MTADELTALAAKLRTVAAECGAIVVNADLGIDGKPRVAEIEADALVEVVRHLRPRAVYLSESLFSIEDEIDGELVDEARLKAFGRKWKKREGQLCRVTATALADGVFHLVIEEADWVSDFRSELSEIADVVSVDTQAFRDADARERRDERRKAMRVLLADPRFNAPKGSKAKREFLAETLFPEMSPHEIMDVVSDAESALWLEGLA